MKAVATVAAIVGAGVATLAAIGSPGYVIGKTPRETALGAAKRFAIHEVRVRPNYPLTYKLDNCRLLFRQPWVGWGCYYEIDGYGPTAAPECDLLVVAVKRVAAGTYRGTGIRLKTVRVSPCPTAVAAYG
jgi:hypothetical protein